MPSFRVTKQTSKNVTDTNFKYKWQDGIWTHKFEYSIIMPYRQKYGLGVSHFQGTSRLILLICKFDKWSNTFSLIIVSSFLTLLVYFFG